MISADQVHNSLKRILAFYTHLDAPKIALYVSAVHEAFCRLDPTMFDKACFETMKALDADSKALPRPGEIKAYYHILQDAAEGKRGTSPPTQAESDDLCIRAIDRYYSPEMAHEKLKELDADARTAKYFSSTVLQALMQKASTADPEKLEARRVSRERFKHSAPTFQLPPSA